MKVIILTVLVVMVSGQDDSGHQVRVALFKSLDTSGDNHLTMDELMADYLFADTDGNGVLTYKEYFNSTLAQNPNADPNDPDIRGPFNYYDSLDHTKDNHLDRADVTIFFNLLNTNGDSSISQHEFDVEFSKMESAIAAEIANLKSPVGK